MRSPLACLALAAVGCASIPAREDARQLYRQAVQSRLNGDDDRAIELAGKVIGLDPANVEARMLRAVVLDEMGRFEEAVADFAEVLRHDEKSWDALAGRALALSELGRHDEAIADGDRLAAEPGGDGVLLRGYLLARAGRTAEAERDYAEARKRSQDRWRAFYNTGVGKLRAGRLAAAERHLTLACALAPGCQEIHVALGRVHTEARAFERALADYSRALELEEATEILYLRGEVRRAMNCPGEAICDFDRSLKREPNAPHVRLARGLALQAKGDTAGADADFTEAIRLNPGFREAYHYRGLLRYGRKALEAAEKDFVAALGVSATVEDVRALGLVYADLDQIDKAVSLYEQALKLPFAPATLEGLQRELAELQKRKQQP